MLAKAIPEIPPSEGMYFEPKWDGFRALVFRDGEDLYVQSRDKRPLLRYFPELSRPLQQFPADTVVDGEIVLFRQGRLEFEALQQRIHPAESRIHRLAQETPTQFVAFDLMAFEGEDLRSWTFEERRRQLEGLFENIEAPVMLTPLTRDIEVAKEWFDKFEGAGLDGLIAKPAGLTYLPKKRAMFKIKHRRTADCVVCGFRWHKQGPGTEVGSLLLGLYDEEERLHHVGVASAFRAKERLALAERLEPLRDGALENHPWADWASARADAAKTGEQEPTPEGSGRMPGGLSRWSQGKNLNWEPLRLERVVEVKYDFMQGDRFRHATTVVRWRDDKRPEDCRYDQLETPEPFDARSIWSA